MRLGRGFLPAAAALLVALPALTPPSRAHHSFAMFDQTKETWIEGTVKEFQWSNPHTFIQVEADHRGRTVEWSLEGGSPNILSRNGWKRTSLTNGERVRVLIYPLRDGRPGGSFLEVHKTDGSVLYYHG